LSCFSFEIGDEFGVVALGKVGVFDVVLDEVQRNSQV
jgi:hypothetical protein